MILILLDGCGVGGIMFQIRVSVDQWTVDGDVIEAEGEKRTYLDETLEMMLRGEW